MSMKTSVVITVYNRSEMLKACLQVLALNNVRIDEETMMVIDYSKQKGGMDYVEAGVLVLKKDVLEFMPPSGSFSMETDLFPRLIELGEMTAYKSPDRFYDIGTIARLKEFESVIDKYFD